MVRDIYFYWGNDTMSYMRYMTLYSFCKFNPDWNVYLIKNNIESIRVQRWVTPELQDKSSYIGTDYTKLIKELNIKVIEFKASMIDLDEHIINAMSDVHIKDILNWKILSDGGGIVADMDILFTKPLAANIDSDTDVGLVCFEGHPKKDYIPVTFMYSSGNNSFFEKVYRNALKNYNPSVYESCGTLCIEESNIQEIADNFSTLKVQRLIDEIVFPLINYEWGLGVQMLYSGDSVSKLMKDSIGVHWYGGTRLSQHYNNIIDCTTVNKINNTLTILMRKM